MITELRPESLREPFMSKQSENVKRGLIGGISAVGLTVTMTLANVSQANAMLVITGGGGSGGGGTFGTANIQKFTDGLEFYALVACVTAIFISAILWAMGSKGQNPGQELTGKRGLILSVSAAFLIGAIPGIMGFLDTQAHSADTTGVTTASASAPTGGNTGTNCSFANSHQSNC